VQKDNLLFLYSIPSIPIFHFLVLFLYSIVNIARNTHYCKCSEVLLLDLESLILPFYILPLAIGERL